MIKRFKKLLIIVVFIFLFYMGIYLVGFFCKIDIPNSGNYYLYDSNNELINAASDSSVELDSISPYLINATISIEDKNFYKHKGFDFLRIIKSLWINIKNKETLQGASTITQQYAKNLFLSFDKTWKRKIKEAWLTIRIESQYTKEEILQGYLNTINYGGVYGIENASYYYFNKSSKDLTLAEATILAGIPKSPSNYSPLINLENSKKRQKKVLNALLKNEYITSDELDIAYNTELSFYGYIKNNNIKTLRYYEDAVYDELEDINISDSISGIKIYTTLNMDVQNTLDKSIEESFLNKDLQLASIVMEPSSGKVLGLVGGYDYNKSQYNRALYSKRQVGSTLKPFLYYTALENGFTESTTFTSEETTFLIDNEKTYSPSNYNKKYANKNITMAAAIAYSDNIYAVKTHLFLGEESLVETLNRVGIKSKLKAIPSLALGSEELTLIEMVESYGTLANLGVNVEPYFIEKIEDLNGNIIYEHKSSKEQVLNSSLTYIVNEILTSTYNYNFIDYTYPTCYDIASKLTNKYSIKTGSTDSDHLIFGYNKDIVVGLWSGFDDNSNTDNKEGKYIRNILADVLENYFKDKETSWYDIPDNVVGVLMDPVNGTVATEDTKNKTMFYYIKGTEPTYNNDLESLIPTVKEEDTKKEQ